MSIQATEIIGETYEDVRLLVYQTVHTFHRRYGGDVELMVSKANESFMEAYHSFDPESGSKFSTWVRFRVWNGLHDERRDQARRHRILKRQPSTAPLDGLAATVDLNWSEVSKDVEMCLTLVLTPPVGLKKLLETRSPVGMRAVLREYLIGLGWTLRRVKKCFEDIQGVLNHE